MPHRYGLCPLQMKGQHIQPPDTNSSSFVRSPLKENSHSKEMSSSKTVGFWKKYLVQIVGIRSARLNTILNSSQQRTIVVVKTNHTLRCMNKKYLAGQGKRLFSSNYLKLHMKPHVPLHSTREMSTD